MHQVTRGLAWGGAGAALLLGFSLLGTTPGSTSNSPDDSPAQETTTGSPTPEPEPSTSPPSPPPGNTSEANSEKPPEKDSPDSGLDGLDGDQTVSAREQLNSLAIKGRAQRTGYDREGQFGSAWLDVDGNGCDTRNDILLRDLDDAVVDSRCRVLSGTLDDPFSGEQLGFERGETTSVLVQIDHVVPLSNAWQTGAQQLDQTTRVLLANDPLNLIAVQGRLNAQKGDGDAATWLPPNRDYWCEYVARQIGVKIHYGLWVTQPEFDRISDILDDCPNYPALSPDAHGRYRPGDIPGG